MNVAFTGILIKYDAEYALKLLCNNTILISFKWERTNFEINQLAKNTENYTSFIDGKIYRQL